MLNREFSKREKVLMLILVVLVLASLYYMLVFKSTAQRIEDANNSYLDAQTEITVEAARNQRLNQMTAAIEEYESQNADNLTVIPKYDNIDNVMVQLDAILNYTSEYSLTFGDLIYGDDYITRPVDMTFSCGSYSAAKDIIGNLDGCVYKCSLDDITVQTARENDGLDITSGAVTVRLTATFYEAYN